MKSTKNYSIEAKDCSRIVGVTTPPLSSKTSALNMPIAPNTFVRDFLAVAYPSDRMLL